MITCRGTGAARAAPIRDAESLRPSDSRTRNAVRGSSGCPMLVSQLSATKVNSHNDTLQSTSRPFHSGRGEDGVQRSSRSCPGTDDPAQSSDSTKYTGLRTGRDSKIGRFPEKSYTQITAEMRRRCYFGTRGEIPQSRGEPQPRTSACSECDHRSPALLVSSTRIRENGHRIASVCQVACVEGGRSHRTGWRTCLRSESTYAEACTSFSEIAGRRRDDGYE